MIQIEDWAVIAAILVFLGLCIVYLAYFIVTRKLFPKTMEFQKEINPNTAITVLTIEGSGIIKKIKMKVTETDKSLINMIVDQTSYTVFGIGKEPTGLGERQDGLLTLEVELDKKFDKNFSLFIDNRSDRMLNSNGEINYEIKKPLKITLKTIISETKK
jgi:hypothetical protein